MPLIGSLNFGLKASQSFLHPLKIFFVMAMENFPPSVGIAHGLRDHRYSHGVILGRQRNVFKRRQFVTGGLVQWAVL